MMNRGALRPKKAVVAKATKNAPNLDDLLKARDYTGALALLEFKLKCNDGDAKENLMWIGYAAFHMGNFERVEKAYRELLDQYDEIPEEIHLFLSCALFFQQKFEEADAEADKGPSCGLKNRLLFHIAHRRGNETKLMQYHQNLKDRKEDQLALAAVHYLRSHYQEATDIYKRLLLENRDDLALNVYVAMCYYKLDYYDVSLEILAVYLQTFPSSAVAVNLKACNHFRLYNGKAAEAEVAALTTHGVNLHSNDLIRHNMVVFSNGDHALQVLPNLVDVVPEAKLNLVRFCYVISIVLFILIASNAFVIIFIGDLSFKAFSCK